MKPHRPEDLLPKAPRLRVPEGLRDKLEADITLPLPTRDQPTRVDGLSWFKRWLPALSLTSLLFGCLIAFAVQSNLISELRQQNEALRAAQQATAEQSDATVANQQRLAADNLELERLRRDAAELKRLQQEAAQLREQLQSLPALRAENQRLLAERAAATPAVFPPGVTAEDDFFAKSKAKADSIHCTSNLKQICLGARMWSNDHEDILPANFITMTNELPTPKVLVCSGDTARAAAANWSEFSPANVSYEMLSPGVDETDPKVVYVRCPIHGHVGMVDGSVQMIGLNGPTRVVLKDGKHVLGR